MMATFFSCLAVALLITALLQRSVGFEKLTHLLAAFVLAVIFSLIAQKFLPYVFIFDLGLLGTVAGAFLGNWLMDRYQGRFMEYLEAKLEES